MTLISSPEITSLINTISFYAVSVTVLLALLLDLILGEAKKYHYLVGFGWLCLQVEELLNPEYNTKTQPSFSLKSAFLGAVSWGVLVLPLPILYFYFLNDFVWYWQIALDGVILYLAIGLNSLKQHAMQVYRPLTANNLTSARHYTGYLVSRDTKTLTPNEMSRATVESMLENGHDSVIASIIYYLIGGAPLVILHRFANTLDAMWGYKNSRYNSFGFASARLDDMLGFVTAKCCTLLYALQGAFVNSVKNACIQGSRYKSHNGGWVMAAGATVMNITLGGSANYHGIKTTSVILGCGKAVTITDIPRSVALVERAAIMLFILIFCMQTFSIIVADFLASNP